MNSRKIKKIYPPLLTSTKNNLIVHCPFQSWIETIDVCSGYVQDIIQVQKCLIDIVPLSQNNLFCHNGKDISIVKTCQSYEQEQININFKIQNHFTSKLCKIDNSQKYASIHDNGQAIIWSSQQFQNPECQSIHPFKRTIAFYNCFDINLRSRNSDLAPLATKESKIIYPTLYGEFSTIDLQKSLKSLIPLPYSNRDMNNIDFISLPSANTLGYYTNNCIGIIDLRTKNQINRQLIPGINFADFQRNEILFSKDNKINIYDWRKLESIFPEYQIVQQNITINQFIFMQQNQMKQFGNTLILEHAFEPQLEILSL